uniref:Secreted protein n=1 Tax=Cannabis sativa TaxID=3483 RepID=A0A803QF12_CANSA
MILKGQVCLMCLRVAGAGGGLSPCTIIGCQVVPSCRCSGCNVRGCRQHVSTTCTMLPPSHTENVTVLGLVPLRVQALSFDSFLNGLLLDSPFTSHFSHSLTGLA